MAWQLLARLAVSCLAGIPRVDAAMRFAADAAGFDCCHSRSINKQEDTGRNYG
jgi:hypothetical protein